MVVLLFFIFVALDGRIEIISVEFDAVKVNSSFVEIWNHDQSDGLKIILI